MLTHRTMTDFVLRPAVEKDFQTIKRLIRETGINPTGLDWHRFVVAESANGEFAGCGQLKPHSGGVVELASIAVVVGQRRQGLAGMIIRKLLELPKRPVYLTCRSSLETFYARFGFHKVNNEKLPKYFAGIAHLAGIFRSVGLIRVELLVMVLE